MIIRPLAARRTHDLPSSVGAEGIIKATTKAHESERFLVLANDLTRCLGIGDITVVRTDGNWQLPVSYEIKSHVDSEKSTRIRIDVHRATRVGSAEEALALDFETMLGAVDAPLDDQRPSKKGEKQLSQLMERSKLVDNISRRALESTRPMRRFRWKAIANVLEKALTTGMSFDSLEKGVVYVGMRNSFGQESKAAMRRLHRRLLDFGFGSRLRHLTSADFAMTDSFAAVIPPMAMWPLSFHHRAHLMSGDLFYACLLDPTIWKDTFGEHGIDWQPDGRRWLLQAADQKVMFNRFDVVRIELGVYFAAVSPREVVAAVADLLSRRTT